MAITWNNTYEQNPKNFNNPGYGANQIRQLKTAVRDRLDREHIFGQSESDLNNVGGTHREGSARVYVNDPNNAVDSRQDRMDEPIDVGRVRVDFTQLDSARTLDGEMQTGWDAERVKKIEVTSDPVNGGSNPGWQNLFSADDFVDTSFDQDINGRKNFSLSPQVPDVPSEFFDDDYTYAEGEDKYAVNVGQMAPKVSDAKYHNPFDVTLNADYNVAQGGTYYKSTTINGVSQNVTNTTISTATINAEVVNAEQVLGVVWL